MTKRKDRLIDLSDITPEEKLKYEIAEELGLLDKVLSEGWRSLSAKETGRIGGLIARKKEKMRKNNKNITNVN
ncbi:MAG: small, acid-soluble spore protein, alpha/beta type [Lachnoclostridium sp.]